MLSIDCPLVQTLLNLNLQRQSRLLSQSIDLAPEVLSVSSLFSISVPLLVSLWFEAVSQSSSCDFCQACNNSYSSGFSRHNLNCSTHDTHKHQRQNTSRQGKQKLEKGSCETTCLFTLEARERNKIQTIRLMSNILFCSFSEIIIGLKYLSSIISYRLKLRIHYYSL